MCTRQLLLNRAHERMSNVEERNLYSRACHFCLELMKESMCDLLGFATEFSIQKRKFHSRNNMFNCAIDLQEVSWCHIRKIEAL
jgi:hypothetical protein